MTRPEDPTKEGFALAGWYSDFDMTKEWDFSKDTVQGSITLYAKWVAPSQLPAGGFHMPLWGWIALGAVLLAVAAVVCAAFGIPGLLIALLVGAALFTLAKLLLTQGPLGTKLAKFFSLG